MKGYEQVGCQFLKSMKSLGVNIRKTTDVFNDEFIIGKADKSEINKVESFIQEEKQPLENNNWNNTTTITSTNSRMNRRVDRNKTKPSYNLLTKVDPLILKLITKCVKHMKKSYYVRQQIYINNNISPEYLDSLFHYLISHGVSELADLYYLGENEWEAIKSYSIRLLNQLSMK